MIKKINLFGNEVLWEKAIEVPMQINTPNSLTDSIKPKAEKKLWPDFVVNHIKDLVDTAEDNHENTLGLSSNQIWDDPDSPPLAIFIIKVTNEKERSHDWLEFINPKLSTSGNTIKITEGCLSIPNFTKKIARKSNVTITYQNLMSAEPITTKVFLKNSGMIPIVLQHEFDHLNGKLIKPRK